MDIVVMHVDVWSAFDYDRIGTEVVPPNVKAIPSVERVKIVAGPVNISGVIDKKNVGRVSRGVIKQEWLCWRGPAAIYLADRERKTNFFQDGE
jgi:hypothetical protein